MLELEVQIVLLHGLHRGQVGGMTLASTGLLAPLEAFLHPQPESREEKTKQCGNPDAEQTTINAGNHTG
jgi:hypothetical protein